MSQAPSMPMFVDAMLADTMHLTTEEFGAYHFILYTTWRNNGNPLGDDDAMLARICRVTLPTWRKLRPILVRFFDLSEGTWRQKRLEKEWVYVQERAERSKENGRRGGRPKGTREEPRKNPLGSQQDTQTESTHTHTQDLNKKDTRENLKFSPDANQIVTALDDAIAESYGAERRRFFRHANDHHDAQQMIDGGASVDVICDTIRYFTAQWAAEGQDPPTKVGSFKKFVASAMRDRMRSKFQAPKAPESKPQTQASAPDSDEASWIVRVRLFRKNPQTWSDNWGPRPGDPGCKAPSSALIEPVKQGDAA